MAKVGFGANAKRAWLVMLLANLVDLDHLLADPIYDPCRCSIAFHPLHSYVAIALYVVMLFPRPSRTLALGLLLHMAWDRVDCEWMRSECHSTAAGRAPSCSACERL